VGNPLIDTNWERGGEAEVGGKRSACQGNPKGPPGRQLIFCG